MSPDDPVLKERLGTATRARHAATERARLLDRRHAADAGLIAPEKIRCLAIALTTAMQNGDIGFRKAYPGVLSIR